MALETVFMFLLDKRDPGIMNENQDAFVGENDKSFYDNHQHRVSFNQ